MTNAAPDSQKIIEFVSARLDAKPEESDVVNDLLAYLAERMIDRMNRIYRICRCVYPVHPVNPVEIITVRRAQKLRIQRLCLLEKSGTAGGWGSEGIAGELPGPFAPFVPFVVNGSPIEKKFIKVFNILTKPLFTIHI